MKGKYTKEYLKIESMKVLIFTDVISHGGKKLEKYLNTEQLGINGVSSAILIQ